MRTYNTLTTSSYCKCYPYGEEITGTANDTYKYADSYRDSDSGLDYAGARYYSNSLGRFLSVDGGGVQPLAPQRWNRYSYALNDPVNFMDSGGLDPTPVGGGCTWDPATATISCGPIIGPPGTPLSGSGGGPGAGNSGPSGPDRRDAPPTSPWQIMTEAAGQISEQVRKGNTRDCDGLSAFADIAANQFSKTKDFVAQFGLLTPSVPIPGVNGTPHPILFTFPSVDKIGFLPAYQDEDGAVDQAHHFAAFFQFGFTYGSVAGAAAANIYEVLEGTAGNTGDINLGTVASQMGADLASGKLRADQIGTAIGFLCKHN